MPSPATAQLIARALPELVYPGDGKSGPVAIPLPMFRSTGITPEMAEQFAKDAGLPPVELTTLVGEAIVHVIESNAKTIIDNAELEALRQAAAEREHLRHRQVEVSCHCGTKLFKANVTDFDTDRAKISPEVIKAMRVLSPECALAHRAVGA